MKAQSAEKVINFIIAPLLVAGILSPLFITAIHDGKLVEQCAANVYEGVVIFRRPQECWLTTFSGMIYLAVLLVALIGICVLMSRLSKSISLRLFLVIIIIGWITTIAVGLSTFFEHKDNHISIGQDVFEYQYKNETITIEMSEIKKIIQRDRAFIIVYNDNKSLRISDVMVSKLCGSQLLRGKLQEMSQTR